MMKKWIAVLLVIAMAAALTACGAGKETTVTGLVIAVDGTKISLVEMDAESMGSMEFEAGEAPQGMEGAGNFPGFGGFDPESFDGEMPEGFEGGEFPRFSGGEMPEGMEFPEGMTPPDGMEFPKGMMPENGERPEFSGESGAMAPDFSSFASEEETKELDLSKAHISVEVEGGKEGGSMENIRPGTFVTVTVNGKGEATYVLVSSQSFFGGRPAAN